MKKATAVAKTAEVKTTKKKARIETVDQYIAGVPEDMRTTLTKLRKTIKATAPSATEIISYQIPAYKQDGLLVGFAASKTLHLSHHEHKGDARACGRAKGLRNRQGQHTFPGQQAAAQCAGKKAHQGTHC